VSRRTGCVIPPPPLVIAPLARMRPSP
jgi:hypothetical protein